MCELERAKLRRHDYVDFIYILSFPWHLCLSSIFSRTDIGLPSCLPTLIFGSYLKDHERRIWCKCINPEAKLLRFEIYKAWEKKLVGQRHNVKKSRKKWFVWKKIIDQTFGPKCLPLSTGCLSNAIVSMWSPSLTVILNRDHIFCGNEKWRSLFLRKNTKSFNKKYTRQYKNSPFIHGRLKTK